MRISDESERRALLQQPVTRTVTMGPRHPEPTPLRTSPARAGVFRTLVAMEGPVTVTTLAAALHQHPNTVREHLDALVAEHVVERVKSVPEGRGRPAWLYQATESSRASTQSGLGPTGYGSDIVGAGHEYAALAAALIEQVASASPHPRDVARQAGERWGRSLVQQRAASLPASGERRSTDPRNTVVQLLTELRFSPERARQQDVLRLTTCPILDAARLNPDVVCQVHLGIVRGTLESLGGDPDGAELTAFAEPGACLLAMHTPR